MFMILNVRTFIPVYTCAILLSVVCTEFCCSVESDDTLTARSREELCLIGIKSITEGTALARNSVLEGSPGGVNENKGCRLRALHHGTVDNKRDLLAAIYAGARGAVLAPFRGQRVGIQRGNSVQIKLYRQLYFGITQVAPYSMFIT